MQLFRGADTLQFEKIHEILGVCGSLTEPVYYSFDDELPLANSWNHYKLALGAQGFSQVASAEFYIYGEDGYLVMPNPVRDRVEIRYNNTNNLQYQVGLISLAGQSMLPAMQVQSDRLDLNLAGIPAGQYFLQLRSETGQVIIAPIIKVD